MKRNVLIIGAIIFVIVIFVIYKVNDNIYDDDYYKYLDNIDYKVSSEFEESKYSKGYYRYYNDDISCNFSIDSFSTYSYKDGSEYLKDDIRFTLNDKVSDINEVDLNGYKWYSLTVEHNNEISYYYATVKDDNGYLLEYKIRDYNNGDYGNSKENFCYVEYDRIISSISFK